MSGERSGAPDKRSWHGICGKHPMKTKSLVLLAVLASWLAVTVPKASAVPVEFSGGNSTQLTMTLPQAIEYDITGSETSATVDIRFTGLNVQPHLPAGPSTITLSLVGDSGPVGLPFEIGANFVSFSLPSGGLSAGETLVLGVGSFTTFGLVSTSPVTGDYNTFVTDLNGNTISAPGRVVSSVPDNGSTAMLLGIGFIGIVLTSRCRIAAR
jgi:hypothetical protein